MIAFSGDRKLRDELKKVKARMKTSEHNEKKLQDSLRN